MTPAQIANNPFARRAELLRRVEKQEARETVLFRVVLIALALVGAWLIWLRNSYAGGQALGVDAILIAAYWAFIAIKLRDDIRN